MTRPDVQAELVGLAQRQTVREFSAAVARMVAEQDPDTLERGAAAQHRARFFVMSHQADGTYLRGRLDRLAGESLRVAIASVGQAPDADGTSPRPTPTRWSRSPSARCPGRRGSRTTHR